MRTMMAVLVVAASVTAGARAQNPWRTEVGIQGGFTRLVRAGSGASPLDAVSLPGFNLGSLVPSAPGLYVVFPWKDRLAIEADVAASQFTTALTVSLLTLGLRADYALTDRVYAAAGGALAYNNGLGANETQLGIQAALGYRQRLSGAVQGRAEARATFFGKAENIGAINAYSVLVGLSTTTTRARAARAAPRPGRRWTPQLGIAGGYANVHIVGGVSLSALAIPSYGGGLGPLTTSEVTLPPTVFAIIPIGARVALEPALDIHRFQDNGQTEFTANASVRLDYAVWGGWYGGLGGNLHYITSTGADAAARTGLNLGWGYRFALGGAFGGRVEMTYTMFGANTDRGLAPTNTLGIMVGVTIPLD